MRIAFLVGDFPSLSQTFILNQITGLIDRGHEVDIYADLPSNLGKQHEDVGKYDLLSHTHYYPKMPSEMSLRLGQGLKLLGDNYAKDPELAWRSLNIFNHGKSAASLKLFYTAVPFFGKRQTYDIIQAHFGMNGLKGAFLRKIEAIGGKLVTTFHGIDISGSLQKFGDRIYDPLFNCGDLFLPISKCWQWRLMELGCESDKILVHHMGIDVQKFTFTMRQLPVDKPVQIVTIARLVEKKGIEYGIRAVAKLINQERISQGITYNIVGDGDLKSHLAQLIQELGMSQHIKLVGWKSQQEIIESLNNAQILLAPSITAKDGDQEGIPVVLMEAMAMGLPVLSTQHSGIPELITDGISGFLVPEKDVEALAEKLNYLINNPELGLQVSLAGRSQVENYYDIHNLNDELVKTYEELLI